MSVELITIGGGENNYHMPLVVATIIVIIVLFTLLLIHFDMDGLDIIVLDFVVLIISSIIGYGYLTRQPRSNKIIPMNDNSIVNINDIHLDLEEFDKIKIDVKNQENKVVSLEDISIYLNDNKSDIVSDIKTYLNNQKHVTSDIKQYLNNKSDMIINYSKNIISNWLSKKYNKVVPLNELRSIDVMSVNDYIPISIVQTELTSNNIFNLDVLNTSDIHKHGNGLTFTTKDQLLPFDPKWMKDMNNYITNLDKYAFFTLYSYSDYINNLISSNEYSFIADYIKKEKNWTSQYFPFFYTAIELLYSRSNNINIDKDTFYKSIIINDTSPMYIMDTYADKFNNSNFNNKTLTSSEVFNNLIDNNISYSDKYILLLAISPNLSYDKFWKTVIEYHLINLHEIINKSPALVEPMILYGQAKISNNEKINNLDTFTIANMNMGTQMLTLMSGTHVVLRSDMSFLVNNNSYYYNVDNDDIVITF